MAGRAIISPLPDEGDVRVVEHEFESADVAVSSSSGFAGADFSQLLDFWARTLCGVAFWARTLCGVAIRL